jgi:hypothetical protein
MQGECCQLPKNDSGAFCSSRMTGAFALSAGQGNSFLLHEMNTCHVFGSGCTPGRISCSVYVALQAAMMLLAPRQTRTRLRPSRFEQ